MATTLTKSYQRISTISLSYGEIRTYAKYNSQNTANNTTSYNIKSTYYARQWVSFSSATATLDGTSKTYGYTTMNQGETTIQELTRTLTHNANGSSPTKTISTSWNATYGGSGSASGQIVAPTIKRFATISNVANSFTDEDTPSFTFNNPANGTMSAWLEINPTGQHIAVREITGTSGTFTWDLTEEEHAELRRQLPTASTGTIRIGLHTTVGTSTGSNHVDRPFTIIGANPHFHDFTFADINPKTLALTGDSSVCINGYSNIRATIPVANKAIAVKEATMVKYRLAIGDASVDIVYQDNADVYGTINSATNGIINVYAIDSRSNSTLVTKQSIQNIIYDSVYINKQTTNVQRSDNRVGDECILTLNGTLWNGNFGDSTNSLTVTYQFKKSSSTVWIDGTTTITPTITDNDFTFTGYIASDNADTSWDLNENYDIKIIVSDKLSSAEFIGVLNSAIPTMSFDRDGVGIMCSYDASIGGGLQVYGEPISGGVYDSGNGFIKFVDGTMVCYGKYQKTLNINNSWGSLYTSGNGNYLLGNYAEEFTDVPEITYSIKSANGACFVICDQNNLPTKSNAGGLQLGRGTTMNNANVTVSYIAIGKWK